MTKTVCDICGKEMPLEIRVIPVSEYQFCISSYGKAWDVCDECREALNDWINKRKAESEETQK